MGCLNEKWGFVVKCNVVFKTCLFLDSWRIILSEWAQVEIVISIFSCPRICVCSHRPTVRLTTSVSHEFVELSWIMLDHNVFLCWKVYMVVPKVLYVILTWEKLSLVVWCKDTCRSLSWIVKWIGAKRERRTVNCAFIKCIEEEFAKVFMFPGHSKMEISIEQVGLCRSLYFRKPWQFMLCIDVAVKGGTTGHWADPYRVRYVASGLWNSVKI